MSATSAKMELLNFLVDSFKQAKTLAEENKVLRARVADLEEAHRWIPVTERLPEYAEDTAEYVIAVYKMEGSPHIMQKNCQYWEKYGWVYLWDKGKPQTFEEWGYIITHWKHKPAPPEDDNA